MAKCIDCKYYNPNANIVTACRISPSLPHGAYCTEFEQATVQQETKESTLAKMNKAVAETNRSLESLTVALHELNYSLEHIKESAQKLQDLAKSMQEVQ